VRYDRISAKKHEKIGKNALSKKCQIFVYLFNVVMLDPMAAFKASMDMSAATGMIADTVHLND
jgi:hypothetical protein